MQHYKKLILELRRPLQLSFICESLCKIQCRDYGEEDIPRCGRNIVIALLGFPLVVVNHPFNCHNFEAAVNVVELLEDDHLLLPPVNPFHGRVV